MMFFWVVMPCDVLTTYKATQHHNPEDHQQYIDGHTDLISEIKAESKNKAFEPLCMCLGQPFISRKLLNFILLQKSNRLEKN
jgi:hypothetical protein